MKAESLQRFSILLMLFGGFSALRSGTAYGSLVMVLALGLGAIAVIAANIE